MPGENTQTTPRADSVDAVETQLINVQRHPPSELLAPVGMVRKQCPRLQGGGSSRSCQSEVYGVAVLI